MLKIFKIKYEFSKKREEIQKNNMKKIRNYIIYTLSKLEKNLAEFINVKKRVLEL